MKSILTSQVSTKLLLVLTIFYFISIPTTSQDQKDQLERTKKYYRKGTKDLLRKQKIKKQFSEEGLSITRKILDRSISDKTVVEMSIKYIRKRYLHSLQQSYKEDKRLSVKIIKNKKGAGLFDLVLDNLVLRGRVKPLRLYEELTGQLIGSELVKSSINTIAKHQLEKDDWKAIWYAPDLLGYHLERVLRRDKKQKFKYKYLINGETPRVKRYLSEAHTEGITWIIGDLIALKQHYGNRQRFQEFVFNYPLYSFSRLQTVSLSDQFSDDEIVRLFVKYGKKLIDDPERRKEFYRRVTGSVRDEVRHEFMKKAGITGEDQ